MVIETKEFPYFKHAYKGVYGDCYLVGIAEIFIFRTGAAEPCWEPFTDRLPESLNEFRELVSRLQAEGAKLITFTMVTPNGIAKRDFEVADILEFEQAKVTGPLAGVAMPVQVILNRLDNISIHYANKSEAEVDAEYKAIEAAAQIIKNLQQTIALDEVPERVKEFIREVNYSRVLQKEFATTPDNSLNKEKRNDLVRKLRDSRETIDTLLLNVLHFINS